jgi:uncharacterized membrane protein YbhN (UPF0104 family)
MLAPRGKAVRVGTSVKSQWVRFGVRARRGYAWLEEKPLVIVLAAAAATTGVALVLASEAGWPRLLRRVHDRQSWSWLLVCLVGELVAYGGYVLTVRDMARVDDGSELQLRASVTAVVAGFGVFAATRSSGGFAVDYWAFREAGATKREAVRRVLGLGFLEYVMLSLAALAASGLLFFGLDGRAGLAATLPSLIVIPVLALALWLTSPKRAARLSRARSGWLRGLFADSVAGATTVRHLLTSPREHGLGVLGNGLYWAGDILCLWAALRLFNAHIAVAALVLGYSGGYVLTRRALPAGGAGFVEIVLTLALVGMGLHFAPALLGVVVYRLFNFWLPIVPALALMPAISELRRRFRHAEQAS